MSNARSDVLEAQREVFKKFEVPLEQVCSTLSHGAFLTETLRTSVDTEVIVFFDIDAVPLRPDVVDRAVKVACAREAIVGAAQEANHLEALKYWAWHGRQPWLRRLAEKPHRWIRSVRGLPNPPYVQPLRYVGPCFMVVPLDVYRRAGSPSLEADDSSYLDVGAKLTVAVRSQGMKAITIHPTHSEVPKYRLGDRLGFGLGVTYGRQLVYHAFESTYVSGSRSPDLFMRKCREILQGVSA
ncbi:MAG: hypothetical protein ACK4PI_08165 [Tepidisphaerales bacterium]